MSALRASCCTALLAGACLSPPSQAEDAGRPDDGATARDAGGDFSLRFFGQPFAEDGINRVWIPAGADTPAGRLGEGAFTIELWLKLDPDAHGAAGCEFEWYNNNIVLDREFFLEPQDGNIGLAVFGTGEASGLAFGFEVAGVGQLNWCGDQVDDPPVVDGAWHHIAAVRRPSNQIKVFIDGLQVFAALGPIGDGGVAETVDSEREGDHHMVLGGTKFIEVAGDTNNTFGWIDDLRLSDTALYVEDFVRPTEPLEVLPSTTALYSFDEGAGTTSANRAGNGPDAMLRVGGSPSGPAWSDDTPFSP